VSLEYSDHVSTLQENFAEAEIVINHLLCSIMASLFEIKLKYGHQRNDSSQAGLTEAETVHTW
jgi:hypothetical protein